MIFSHGTVREYHANNVIAPRLYFLFPEENGLFPVFFLFFVIFVFCVVFRFSFLVRAFAKYVGDL